jgi:thiol:disulfide interchange protein DsbD
MRTRSLVLLLAAALRGGGAEASPAATGASKHVRATLAPAVTAIQPGRPFQVGVRLEMQPRWHTYWRNPGDSGLPTKIRWTLPEGFTAGEIRWPRPQRFLVEPLMSYGYAGEVWLVSEIRPAAGLSGREATIAARVDWLECEEICIPGKAELAVTLPVRDAAPPRGVHAPAIEAARALVPGPPAFRASASAAGDALQLRVTGAARPRAAYFFPAVAGVVEHASPQRLEASQDGFTLRLERAANASLPVSLDGVLELDGHAFEVRAPLRGTSAGAAAGASPAPPSALTLPLALGLAFLGGLVLNLMPCVLPVLSLKVLGFVRHGAEGRGPLAHAGAFTAGVVVFFLALALGLVALRKGGEEIGWGFQLQSPGFVVFLAMLFLLLGLNLLGVFEVGQSLTAAGNLARGRGGLAGSFWNGALATLVATPCTAPFMGSALGFALGQPTGVVLLVFTALGLGMAAPYVLLASSPALLRRLPRPGGWMETFKQAMGFPLLGTAAFLVWLFGRQVGVDAVGWLLFALLLVAFAAWAYGRAASSAGPRRAYALAAAAIVASLGLLVGLQQAQATPRGDLAVEDGWLAYSPEALGSLRAAGTPVFVDFTADWCLSCQVNERLVLQRREVRERFRARGVVLMKADWTRRDEAITRALAEHGRQGVPLYVLYGRGPQAPPRLLPEVLTPGIVLAALDELE